MPARAAGPARRTRATDRGARRRVNRRHPRGRPHGRRRRLPGHPARRRRSTARLAGQAARLLAARHPGRSGRHRAGLRRRRRGARPARRGRGGRRATRRAGDAAVAVPPNPGHDGGRPAGSAAVAVVVADVPATARDGTVGPAVPGRGRWAVPGRGPGRVQRRRWTRSGVRPGSGGCRVGPGGQTVRRPDSSRRRLTAGHLPDVRRLAAVAGRLLQVAVGLVWPSYSGCHGGSGAPAALHRPTAGRCGHVGQWCTGDGHRRRRDVPARGRRTGGQRPSDRRPVVA